MERSAFTSTEFPEAAALLRLKNHEFFEIERAIARHLGIRVQGSLTRDASGSPFPSPRSLRMPSR
jgi:hypothetical protein